MEKESELTREIIVDNMEGLVRGCSLQPFQTFFPAVFRSLGEGDGKVNTLV